MTDSTGGNMSDWTKEPWRVADQGRIVIMAKGGTAVCATVRTEDAARIVACVNALAGLNPEAVKDVVNALEAIERTALDGFSMKMMAGSALAKLRMEEGK